MIKYSIIICTYNRFQLLEETIISVLSVIKNRQDVEIILVDNNSSDSTSSLKEKYKMNEKVKYFLEKNQGLSYSRNRGMLESNGDILIFFDDDIEIPSEYIDNCDKIYENENINIVGGKVLPFQCDIPDWLPSKFHYLVSVFDLGNKEIETHTLMGANYSMRKSVTKNVGGYNVDLGRKGKNLMGGEENDYLSRAFSQGYKIWYNPDLIVFHKINEKLNFSYVSKYAYLNGTTNAILEKESGFLNYIITYIKSFLFLPITFLITPFLGSVKSKNYVKLNYYKSLGFLKIKLK